MGDDMMNHGQPGPEPGFEREDLGTRGVFAFMLSLIHISEPTRPY